MTATVRPDPTLVDVALGARSYDIVIGRGVIAVARRAHRRAAARRQGFRRHRRQRGASCSWQAAEAALARAGVAASRVIVPAGEASKSFRVFEQVCEAIIASRIERGDLVVALGGGVIGDLAGFAAAVVRRGLDYVQVPTTLLGASRFLGRRQDRDRFRHGKNLIGAFHQPILVLADTAVLDTLPPREFRSGYAELAKYGLLGDAAFFSWLEANWREIFVGRQFCRRNSAREHAIAVAAAARPASSRATSAKPANGRYSISAILSAMRSKRPAAFPTGCCTARLSRPAWRWPSRSRPRHGLVPEAEAARATRHLADVGLPTRIKDIPGPRPTVDQLMEFDCAGQESEARDAYIHPGARYRRGLRRGRRRSRARCVRF